MSITADRQPWGGAIMEDSETGERWLVTPNGDAFEMRPETAAGTDECKQKDDGREARRGILGMLDRILRRKEDA